MTDNLTSWEVFEEKKVECHKHLDTADAEFEQIKKIFDLAGGKGFRKQMACQLGIHPNYVLLPI